MIFFRKNNIKSINKTTTCCFTGHRPQKLPWKFNNKCIQAQAVWKKTEQEIESAIKLGYDTFLCGMALGFDLACAEIVLKLKKQYKIKLYGILPCLDQANKWSASQQENYNCLLKKLDGIRCIYKNYTGAECMHERNQFMIDNSSLVISLFNGKPGGTKKTLDYAKQQGLDIVVISPD